MPTAASLLPAMATGRRRVLAPMLAVLALGLAGCAMVEEKALGWIASPTPATLLLPDRVLSGTLTLGIDRSGTLVAGPAVPPGAVAAADNAVRCSGVFRFYASTTARVDLRCSDGLRSSVMMTVLGPTRGFGSASTEAGPVSLTYGMAPVAARAYLVVPEGRRLVEIAGSPFFELQ